MKGANPGVVKVVEEEGLNQQVDLHHHHRHCRAHSLSKAVDLLCLISPESLSIAENPHGTTHSLHLEVHGELGVQVISQQWVSQQTGVHEETHANGEGHHYVAELPKGGRPDEVKEHSRHLINGVVEAV